MRLRRKLAAAASKLREIGVRGLARLPRDLRTVRTSPLFDAEWYLENNPDVADGGIDPALHYLLFGAAGNRSPSVHFVTGEYLALNADVAASGMNPLVHYERFGRREGRAVSFLGERDPSGGGSREAYARHQSSFGAKCARLRDKMLAGGRLKAVFFVSNASMFPGGPLFDAMLGSERFDPHVVVVPDLRWRDGTELGMMEECRAALLPRIPAERLSVAGRDAEGRWEEVLDGADVVCYPSPYEMSAFRYNPRYSVGRAFLPICVNYGFFRSVYDRRVMRGQGYAWMWKAFFECAETLSEYRDHSAIGGANADLSGYVKMDPLAAVVPARRSRRRVLVAFHHSVEGGSNDMLALSNFARYADFFLELIARHPAIDFVFRPHPFLFKVLSRPRLWGAERVERYLVRLKSSPNVIWSDGGEYFREFAESDACIQDCGSYLVEYFYTGKPCCYMLHEPGDVEAKFAPLGRECLENCYIAYNSRQIEQFVEDVVVKGEDPKGAGREALARRVMVNYPHAAEVALGHIVSGILDQSREKVQAP